MNDEEFELYTEPTTLYLFADELQAVLIIADNEEAARDVAVDVAIDYYNAAGQLEELDDLVETLDNARVTIDKRRAELRRHLEWLDNPKCVEVPASWLKERVNENYWRSLWEDPWWYNDGKLVVASAYHTHSLFEFHSNSSPAFRQMLDEFSPVVVQRLVTDSMAWDVVKGMLRL